MPSLINFHLKNFMKNFALAYKEFSTSERTKFRVCQGAVQNLFASANQSEFTQFFPAS